MDKELLFNNKKYLSSKYAGKISGYTNDYIARLCREKKIEGKMIGRSWYAEEKSLNDFLENNKFQKTNLHKKLSDKRIDDYKYSERDRKIKENVKAVASKVLSRVAKTPELFKTQIFKKATAMAIAATLVFGGYFASDTDIAKAGFKKVSSAMFSGLNAIAEFDPSEFSTQFIFVMENSARNIALNVHRGMNKTKPLALGDKDAWTALKKNVVAVSKNASAFAGNGAGMFSSSMRNSSIETLNAVYMSAKDTAIATARISFNDIKNDIKDAVSNYLSETAKIVYSTVPYEDVRTATASAFASITGAVSKTVTMAFKDKAVYVNQTVDKILCKRFLLGICKTEEAILAQSDINEEAEETATIEENKKVAPTEKIETIKTVINQPVIERIVKTERVLTVSGITKDDMELAIQQLKNKVYSDMSSITSANESKIVNNYNVISQSNKIDKLGSVTISNSTISGTLSGLTDAHIPNDITASNYLPLAGGVLTGELNGTSLTLSGNLTVSGAQTFSGAISLPYFVATSTTATSTIAGGLAIETSGFVYDYSTNRVGIGTTTPRAEFQIDGAGGIIIPSGTTAQRPSSYIGALRYNTTNSTFEGYNGSNWSGLGGVIDVDQDTYILAESSSGADEDVLFFYTAGSERARVSNAGNFGIGTTSPYAKLSVAGSGVFTGGDVLSSTLTATSTATAANFVGSSGTATSTLAGGLTIAGQCVTADTRLRRRRRRKKADGMDDELEKRGADFDDDYIYDEVQIVDIKEGDEIRSLDEKTGALVWSKVNKLMYMGVKQTYKLITETGKSIRTTANHPYLTKNGWTKVKDLKEGMSIAMPRNASGIKKPRAGVFIDNANMFYAQKKAGWKIDYNKLKKILSHSFDVQFMNLYLAIPDKADTAYEPTIKYIEHIKDAVNIISKPVKYIEVAKGKFEKKGNVDVKITADIAKTMKDIDAVILLSGDSDFNDLADSVSANSKKIAFVGFEDNMAWELRQKIHLYLNRIRDDIELGNKKAPSLEPGVLLLDLMYSSKKDLSSISAKYVDNGIFYDKIISIEPVAKEDVYDIEVKGTRNFIGNGIVAHNTYLSREFYAGGTATTTISSAGILTTPNFVASSASATSTLAGGLAIETSGFVYDYSTNNVGIGTASPAHKLDIAGNANISSGSTYKINGTDVLSATTLGSAVVNSSLTSVGTIATGVWNGTAIADANVANDLTISGGTINSTTIGATTPSTGIFSIATTTGKLSSYSFVEAPYFTATSTSLASTFPYASSTALTVSGSTYLGSLTGALQAVNGLVSATSSLSSSFIEDAYLKNNANDTTTGQLTALNFVGSSGTATSTLAGGLTIAGQCVTADTRLRRRRRRKKSETDKDLEESGAFSWDDEYVYDEVMIKNAVAGDEIASMSQKTGELVWSEVIEKMNMGIQDIYQLTTQSGKQIRTTDNHPYFVRTIYDNPKDTNASQKLYRFEVDMSMKIEDFSANSVISVANSEYAHTLSIPRDMKQTLRYALRAYNKPREMKPALFAAAIVDVLYAMNARVHELVIDTEYTGYDGIISNIIAAHFPNIEIHIDRIGKQSPAHFAGIKVHRGKRASDSIARESVLRNNAESALRATFPASPLASGLGPVGPQALLLNKSIYNSSKLVKSGEWIKARDIKKGQMLAVVHGNTIAWEKIIRIEKQEKETVYDVEIDKTRNFIGNGIVAHNTYLSREFYAGGTATTTISSAGILTTPNFVASSASATSTIAGGLAIETSGFVYDYSTNNVGIGTASPAHKLDIAGNANISSGSTYKINGTDVLSATTLGSAVVNSSLTSVGTIATGVWNGTAIADANVANDLTISGGTINSTTIGATTPSTGIFSIATTTGKLSSYSFVEAPYFTATSTSLASTFPYASSTALTVSGSTYLGSLTGALQAVNGLVSATSSLSSSFIEDAYLKNNANDTTTGQLTALNFVGSSGTATSTLAGGLTIAGQCVTADTRLRRRRRRKKNETDKDLEKSGALSWDDEYVYDEVMIKNAVAGDEIASMSQKTGELVWSKVNKLMYMGVKQTYKLITETGKSIRTTANHPYLTKDGWTKVSDLREGVSVAVSDNTSNIKESRKQRAGVFVDASNTYHSEKRAGWKIDYEKLKEFISQEFSVEFMKYYVAVPKESDKEAYEGKISYLNNIRNIVEIIEKPLKYISEKITIGGKIIKRIIKKGDVDVDIAVDAINSAPDLDVVIILSGDSDYIALRDDLIKKGKKVLFIAHKHNLSTELAKGKYFTLNRLRKFIEYGDNKKSLATKGEGTLVPLLYSSKKDLSSISAKYVDNGIFYDKIISIEPVAKEDVYDIEVKGTRNFIGNGIVAHNTYLSGAFYAGGTATTTISSAGILTTPNFVASSASATSTIAGGLAIETSGFVYDYSTNNVGIGTASPAHKLDIAGNANISSGSTYKINGTDVLSAMTLGSGVTASSLTSLGTLTGLTVNSSTITLSQDTDFVISGGTNGMSIDGTTFSVDGTNDRVGIGTTSPATNLHISAVDPEIRLTDTGDSEYTRITRADTLKKAVRYNRVNQPGGDISNLVGHWLMNDNAANTTVADSSGNGNNGTAQQNTSILTNTGKINNSLDFNGSSDYVQTTINQTVTSATFTAWIKADTLGAFDGIFMSRGTSVSGMLVGTSGSSVGYLWNGAYFSWESGLSISSGGGTWNFVAIVVEPTKATAYLGSGSTLSSSVNTATHEASTIDDLKIGQDDNGGRWFDGNIDDVRYYNKAMTLSEIQSLFNSGTGTEGGGQSPATTAEALVWSSQDGTNNNELGIQTFGNTTGRSILEGRTLRFNIAGVEKATINASGAMGIGQTSPTYNLDVTGNAHFTSLVDASHFVATSTTATSTIAGGLTIAGQCVTADTRLRRRRRRKDVLGDDDFEEEDINDIEYTTENTALANGVSDLVFRVSENSFVSSTIANEFNLSSKKDMSVDNQIMKLEKGIEPSEDKMTKLSSRHVSSLRKLYHKGATYIADNDYIYDEVQIVDIKEGDEIRSLDEKTGKLVYSKINKLMYMGKKPIYKITTASGKTIRTTENHPYLTQKEIKLKKKPRMGVFYDSSNIYKAQKKAGWKIGIKKLKKELQKSFEVSFINYYNAIPAEDDNTRDGVLKFMDSIRNFVTFYSKSLKYISIWKDGQKITEKKGDMDVDIALGVTEALDDIDVALIVSGDSDLLALRDYVQKRGKKIVFASFSHNMAWELTTDGSYIYFDNLQDSIALDDNKTNRQKTNSEAVKLGVTLTHLLYMKRPSMSSGVWTKVSQINEGDYIAISDKNTLVKWDHVVSIENLPQEDVYDIEVKGTRNFIGNGIVAHNTYLSGAFYAGGTATTTISSAGILTTPNFVASSASATSTIAGGLAIETSGFVYDYSTNNVGIGTASPAHKLDIAGNANISSGSTYKINGTDVLSATTLGSAVVNSSLTSVGTIATGVWNGTAIADANVANDLTISGGTINSTTIGATTPSSGAFTTLSSTGATTIGNNSSTAAIDSSDWDISATGALTGISGITNDGAYTQSGTSANTFTGTPTFSNATYSALFTGGNVGIGTTAPGAKLEVYNGVVLARNSDGVADPELNIGTGARFALNPSVGANNAFAIGIGAIDGSTYPVWFQTGSLNGGGFEWYIGTSEKMRIDKDGNVGIGTTSPYAKLSVAGSGVFTGGDVLSSTLTATSTATAANFVASSASATSTIAGGLAIETSGFVYDYSTNNVGIGTASPAHKLDIAGNANISSGSTYKINGTDVLSATTLGSGVTASSLTSLGTLTGLTVNSSTITLSQDTDFAISGGTNGMSIDGTTLSIDGTNNRVGIGTTTPYSTLSIWSSGTSGASIFEAVNSASTTIFSIKDDSTFSYGSAATTTIQNSQRYAWTIATSTTVTPIIRIDTSGSGNTGQATTTINGGLIIDGGAITHNYSSGVTSIDNLEMGSLNFDTNAGIVSLADMPVTSAAAIGTVESYSAQIDGNALLTVYAESNGAGGIQNKRIGIGTTTPGSLLSIGGDGTGINFVDGTTATSTISGNLRIKGTLRSTVSYVGDLIFANNFKFTEQIPISTTSIQALYLQNQFGTTTLAIDENGNIGVGTTSPEYKLHIIGDVAATSFVNISTSASKKDIAHLDSAEVRVANLVTPLPRGSGSSILEKLKAVDVAQYRYKYEDERAPLRLGLIAEEAPADVLSAEGKGVDIYKLATFTLAGVQELAEKVGNLETRLADVETQVVANAAAAGGGGSGASLQSVIDYLVSVGVSFVEGITHIASAVIDNLTVGSAEKPNGITLYDEATGEPYCVKMLNGSLTPTQGVCDSGGLSSGNEVDGGGSSTGTISTSTPDGSDTEAPVITIVGNNPANISIGSTYADLGAIVTDNVNDNLGLKTFLDGVEVSQIALSTASTTTYTISYSATDQAGNTATSTRTVIVGDGETASSTPQI